MWKLASLLLFSLFIKAQPYGQFTYQHSGVYTTSAFKTSLNSKGHLLAGYKTYNTTGAFNFCIDKTNPSGGFSSADFSFQNEYKFFNTNMCSHIGFNQILNCSGVSVIETKPLGSLRSWYALTGTYDEGCFFATLDSLGKPLTWKAYMFPYVNPIFNTKSYIVESKVSSGEYYISGTHDSTIYVLKVNSSGNVIWSSYYNNGTSCFSASDILECPFTGNVLVFGTSNAPGQFLTTGTNGYILSVHRNNGNILYYKGYTLSATNCQRFAHAKPALSTSGGQGYIVAAMSQGYPVVPWILKIGTAGNIIWSTVINPSTDNNPVIVEDVIERPVGSTYEYFGVLRSNSGMIVIKLDDYGVPVQTGSNEFKFNSSGTVVSTPSNIDFENSGSNIALTTYGTTDGIYGGDIYMVRSYFNGVSGCNETNTIVANYYQGPDTVINPWINKYGSLPECNIFQLVSFPVSTSSVTLCSNVVVSGGSNGGLTESLELKKENLELNLFPNPTEGKTNLNFKLEIKSKVEIMIYNCMGQYLKTILESEFNTGSYDTEINMTELKLESGIYFLRLTNNHQSSIYKIIYTK